MAEFGSWHEPEARSCSAEHALWLSSEIRGQLPMNCRATRAQVPLNATLERELASDRSKAGSQYRENLFECCRGCFGELLYCGLHVFAPVASRFKTYGSRLDAMLQNTCTSFLIMNKWARVRQAQAEPETIGRWHEVGI